MASTSAAGNVSDDELLLAEQFYEDGVDLLARHDFEEAADLLAQCLQIKAAHYGETSVAAACVSVKYAASLLGYAKQKGQDIFGTLKTKPGNSNGAGTSKAPPPEPEEEGTADDDADDLQLAWENAETGRVFLHRAADAGEDVPIDMLAQAHEVLADIKTEMEMFEEAVADYEKAIKYLDKVSDVDIRWQASLHYSVSLPLEFLDRFEDAAVHVNTAVAKIKYLIKQKQAQRQELEAEARADATKALDSATAPADAAAAGAAAGAVAAAATDTTNGGVDAAGDAAAAAADVAGGSDSKEEDAEDDEDDEDDDEDEEDELDATIREIEELKGVAEDLRLRQGELASSKAQAKAVREQLKAMLGADGGAAFSKPSSDTDVVDLGVVKGRPQVAARKAEEVENIAQGRGTQSKAETAGSSKAPGKRTLDDVMGPGNAAGGDAKSARHAP